VQNLLVGFSQEGLQTEQDGLDVVCGRPLVLENIQADAAGEVDIGMVDGSSEEHGWRCIWIVRGELKAELECETRIWRVIRTLYGCAPG